MRLHGIGGDAWKRYSRAPDHGPTKWWMRDTSSILTDMAAALGRVQLNRCDSFWQRRLRDQRRLLAALRAAISELELPPTAAQRIRARMASLRRALEAGLADHGRNQFIAELKKLGIGTSVHFIPLHHHPFYTRNLWLLSREISAMPTTPSLAVFLLPIFPDMKNVEVERVVEAVERSGRQQSEKDHFGHWRMKSAEQPI